jgi:magnesium chelatase family protein
MQSHTFSSTLIGIEAKLVRVEVAVSNGLPGLVVVGLPDAAVSEAGARVRSAIRASGFTWPPRRVVVNLSPADLRKQGSGFDLALALGVLEALGEIPAHSLASSLIVGELSLDGSVRAVKGLVPALAMAALAPEIDRVLISSEQQESEFVADPLQVHALSTLGEAVEILSGKAPAAPWRPSSRSVSAPSASPRDLREVQGQAMARWALEIAAAGGHHLMMVGPPGCGKSMLASCLPGILPPMTQCEWFEVASVASVCHEVCQDRVRPFRSPGQGTSAVAMLGGQQPGEVTRAHHGVLFLDEFPEFRRDTLEALRQVMETGTVSVVRARLRVVYPACFTLVAAMNPCPCGMFGDGSNACTCSDAARQRYAGKLSGPLRDRFDLLVAMERQPLSSFLGPTGQLSESSNAVRQRVLAAREVQLERGVLNRDLRGAPLRESLGLSSADEAFCQSTGDRLKLSVRALEKWLKVARTLADLAQAPTVSRQHLMSALVLRGPGSQQRQLAS